jgi:hypothetical protein
MTPSSFMAGLGPAIYETPHKVLVDDRAKPGHERTSFGIAA